MDNNNNENIAKQPAKRGRKPSKQKKGYYFGEEEELAFQTYVNSTNQYERDNIFRQKLYPAFTKMVESIIRRYILFVPTEDFDETFHDTLSFLITKINNFDASKGYKLYSYCGTVCKNYLMFKGSQSKKKKDKQLSYDLLFPSADKDTRVDNDEDKIKLSFHDELIDKTISEIQIMLSVENIDRLNENEQKIGYALLEMLMNWEEIFKRLENKKFNKTSVLFFLKEYTMLNSKDIREGMRKYKNLYFFTKEKLINE